MGIVSAKSHVELIQNLRRFNLIKHQRVYEAMLNTDRGNYIPTNKYFDMPQPIGNDQTISAPHMHAIALEHLEPKLKPGCKALDVGCGSGIITVCMARMIDVLKSSGEVVGIEVIPELVQKSLKNVKSDFPELLDCSRFRITVGDGWNPPKGPFDAIHVGAAANEIPQRLLDELSPEGIMFIPVGQEGAVQSVFKITKSKTGEIASKEKLEDVCYVPLVKNS